MSYPLLEKINSPDDLKKLEKRELSLLAEEIRAFLISSAHEHGGHLASNLGVVELTLALHRIFDSPKDRILFDVGHQAYVHKLLTGRREFFYTLRTPGGLSGFVSRFESEHDPFGAGHSSTSVSAALGFAEADAALGRRAYTVAVIGDGAYTGGMVHEALNNCRPELPLIIILNENGMSISSNKGTFASYLSGVRLSRGYRRWKSGTSNVLSRIPLVGRPTKRLLSFIKNRVKRLIYPTNYFEELGLYYIGPIDGNNYEKVEKALLEAKEYGGTVVIHLKTKKGKGYEPAEKSPDVYHGVNSERKKATFHSVAARELISLAEEDSRVAAVTAAMGIGTGLDAFGEKYPERYFDVGIAEEHALTFSAGLAAAGMNPFVAIYSTFLQRGYDNILHDIALQSLPVKILIDRAGLSIGDGPTHHGIFDVAFLSHIPNVELFAPKSHDSLTRFIKEAAASDGPVAIRYSNLPENENVEKCFLEVGSGVSADFDTDNPPQYIFITYGSLIDKVIGASDILLEKGFSVGIIVVERLKPYTDAARVIKRLIQNAKRVIYAEEGIMSGGAAQITLAELGRLGGIGETEYLISAIDDNFARPNTPTDLYDFVGLSANKLAEKMIKNDS